MVHQINKRDNSKVFVSKSKIKNGGFGLFAKCYIEKREKICTYGGRLVEEAEAKYIDPTYIVGFENGHGCKLVGDDLDGDLGHRANSVHPEDPSIMQNARFCMDRKSKKYLPGGRGRFDIISCQAIQPGEEIIVHYGHGYWPRMYKYWENGLPVKSQSILDREERASRRDQFYENAQQLSNHQ